MKSDGKKRGKRLHLFFISQGLFKRAHNALSAPSGFLKSLIREGQGLLAGCLSASGRILSIGGKGAKEAARQQERGSAQLSGGTLSELY